ncbi:hypothetical protein PL321_18955 [Caloramator sp. mosi_1]|uniref:hypothetical protein n=1 Tax=Caloramator sp. mosi_1 TaxID=3023090 RepID=UPI00235FD9B5|nr:hypothetical protein [Caloramator sp. mosi_1]WDC84260.1 hypothetical protein PL321_18955 [Caloramator sp. mosi_1]
MKNVKLYNIIFPLWLLMFLPPLIIITLLGNYLIDSLVLIDCFYGFKLANNGFNLKEFYKKHILKVWGFGFLADFIGAVVIFIINSLEGVFELNWRFINSINFDPFESMLAVIVVLICIAISGFFIYFFNYRYVFNKIEDKAQRHKLALSIALITMPWTFLVPSKIMYR